MPAQPSQWTWTEPLSAIHFGVGIKIDLRGMERMSPAQIEAVIAGVGKVMSVHAPAPSQEETNR
jgi:hypothetical protein